MSNDCFISIAEHDAIIAKKDAEIDELKSTLLHVVTEGFDDYEFLERFGIKVEDDEL